MEKHVIRQRMLARRKQLEKAACQSLSRSVQQFLIAAECFSHARTLALYSPINNEVCTDRLLSAARSQGKSVCYPRVCGEALQFVVVDSAAELLPGAFGVAEPKGETVLLVSEIDLFVVPGIAFDRAGFRLGYGKGFYDRGLSQRSEASVSVGLCFSFQLHEVLPVEDHDQQLDFIATDKQLIPCRKAVAG